MSHRAGGSCVWRRYGSQDSGGETCHVGSRTVSRLERITVDPSICHGQPTVRGLRYPVESFYWSSWHGMTIDEIIEDLPGPRARRSPWPQSSLGPWFPVTVAWCPSALGEVPDRHAVAGEARSGSECSWPRRCAHVATSRREPNDRCGACRAGRSTRLVVVTKDRDFRTATCFTTHLSGCS